MGELIVLLNSLIEESSLLLGVPLTKDISLLVSLSKDISLLSVLAKNVALLITLIEPLVLVLEYIVRLLISLLVEHALLLSKDIIILSIALIEYVALGLIIEGVAHLITLTLVCKDITALILVAEDVVALCWRIVG